ncbi:hypothetical protein SAMN05216167_1453 [Spirosoma endophyticum]|uniref:Uncharacterized protein n=1 Tax=Spirosoma endophyticum TaxID=662367 RepID=A0A1I2HJL3_9BACT|nr:hypothetical protein SAMN05216167_1453 [Spirosoma endophyticum]
MKVKYSKLIAYIMQLVLSYFSVNYIHNPTRIRFETSKLAACTRTR